MFAWPQVHLNLLSVIGFAFLLSLSNTYHHTLSAMNSACPLLALPMEIRIQIYQFLFASALISIDPPHLYCPHIPLCGFTICSCSFPWQIVNTCRQLRYEALPYLLAATTLEVSTTLDRAIVLPRIYLRGVSRAVVLNAKAFFSRPLQFELFHSLRVLELRNITVWCKYHDKEYLESEAGSESMFGLAMFNLHRTNSDWTLLRNQPKRPFNIHLCCQYVVSSLTDETIVRSR